MKKVFDKIISITLGVISLFFVVLMLVTTFGGLEQADLDNNVVKFDNARRDIRSADRA